MHCNSDSSYYKAVKAVINKSDKGSQHDHNLFLHAIIANDSQSNSYFKVSQYKKCKKNIQICLKHFCFLFLCALNFTVLYLIQTEFSGEARLCFVTFD